MSEECEVKKIQYNSANAAFETARLARDEKRKAHLQCLGPAAVGAAALEDANSATTQAMKEAEGLQYMHEFLLQQLGREVKSEQTYRSVGDIARSEADRMREEIERLKGEIRTERRRFLDASPTTSPAVAGLYFTQVPDNQALIAFIACYVSFLLFVGLVVLMGLLPRDLFGGYFSKMTGGDRFKFVGILWIAGLVLGYTGFYMFT